MVLCHQHHGTAGVGLGANHRHAGGLTVPRLVILERTDEIVHTHTNYTGQFFGRISTYNKVRQAAPHSAACHGSTGTGLGWRAVRRKPAGPVPALCTYGHLQAGQPPVAQRGPAAGVAVRGCDATAACGCRTDTCAGALMLRPVASVLAGAEVKHRARQHRCVLEGKMSLDVMPRIT
jgi:hypothetical protein